MTATRTELPLSLTDDLRIAAWRADRAVFAENGRKQRLQIAVQDREVRIAQFELEKEERIEQARLKREAELEQTEISRKANARASIIGLEDLTEAAEEFRRKSRTRQRTGLLRFAFYVGTPVLLTILYLANVATPVFDATTIFAVNDISIDQSSIEGRSGMLPFKVKQYITSADMMAQLQTKLSYMDQFAGVDMDPVQRDRNIDWLGWDKLGAYQNRVRANLDVQDGLITLRVSGRTPEAAVLASQLILALAELRFVSDNRPDITPIDTLLIGNSANIVTAQVIETLSNPYSDSASGQSGPAKIVFTVFIFGFFVYSIFTVLIASLIHHSRS